MERSSNYTGFDLGEKKKKRIEGQETKAELFRLVGYFVLRHNEFGTLRELEFLFHSLGANS